MKNSQKQHERLAKMTFAEVYPLYVAKVVRKGRTETELLQVIGWLTGFTADKIESLRTEKATFKDFFEEAVLPAQASQITGVICGYRIEEIEDLFIRKVRYLDKLVDELARGKALEKILRK